MDELIDIYNDKNEIDMNPETFVPHGDYWFDIITEVYARSMS